MRKFNFAVILIFVFCVGIFSQTYETLPCPKVSLIGPTGIPSRGGSIFYSASVDKNSKNFNLKYIWTVAGANILAGQNTDTINITLDNFSERILVILKIEGLPNQCLKTISEGFYIDAPSRPVKIEELEIPISKTNNIKNPSIVDALQNDPSAQLYVIIYLKNKTTKKIATRREQQILKFLTEKNEIGMEKITILKGVANKEQAQFWIVPAGVKPPVPEN